ncbi:MAG: hypothetical protein KC593_07495 [Myxococcales bacterium]|nr:hypothetical protein [Myxococcales bacterium]MCB9628860.1 hypothetical protein [Sandaracinaceae bacterium]
MTRLAILDELLPAQLRERPDELSPVEVVWSGTDPEKLLRDAERTRPTLLALDLELLGGSERGPAAVRRLVEQTGAELAIVLYSFAKRDVLRDVAQPGVRTVRAPISLSSLRTQMTSVIVRHMLSGAEDGSALRPVEEARAPRPTPMDGGRNAPPLAERVVRRYSREQLGRLREIQSSVDCECPNHLSELLLGLTSFEDYSAVCENKSAADAAVHRMLYDSTVQARAIMEEALTKLMVHEKIVL